MRAVARHPFFANPAWPSPPVDLEGNPVVNRWVQPGEELEVSSREEDWRDCFGAYMEPVEPAPLLEPDEAPKKARKRKQDSIPVPETEIEPAPEPVTEPDPAPAGEGVPE